jgi:N-acetylmuramic acid 6-phosphate (MurNAc-6-P) etherase
MDPITELSNDISADIDLTDATGILSILHQCDSQVFTGWQMHQSIYHPSIIGAIENVSKLAVKMLKNARGGIVFSGCGTSGRLAFLSAVGYSNHFPDKVVSYTIAGGDKALFMSVEAPEDSWRDGVNDLEKITKDLDFVLFIGITCGLSAPYVAGQLDYCLQHLDKYIPVLLGFNPVSLARKNNIDNWDKTFHDVAVAMEKLSCDGGPCYIINPIVGPEAITGSSRMKSGTATKMILDAMFVMTFKQFHNLPMPKCSIPNIFSCYELTYRFTYLSSESISKLIDAAAKS